ncbi:unnamed protein product [Urochloa humidicola]
MKSLQHQIQAMSSFGPAASAAFYPAVVQPAPPYCYLPPAAFAPGFLVRGHVWPGVIPGPPPPAMLPFAATLPLLPHHPAAHGAAGSAAAEQRW